MTAAARTRTTAAAPDSGSPPTVLLAEDDFELRALIAEALRCDRWHVVELESGSALLAELQRRRPVAGWPALIVSDIHMPGFDGLDVLGRLRGWGCTVPAIVVTAFPLEETLNAARAFGASMVLSKPFDLGDLRLAARCFYPREAEP